MLAHVPGLESWPLPPDAIILNQSDLRAAVPSRAHAARASGEIVAGHVDLIHQAAIARLPGYDYYWFVEYDVDFSGSWRSFFAEFEGCDADLLGTTLYPRSVDRHWYHWDTFATARQVGPDRHMRGFFPVLRMSRRFAEFYSGEVASGWRGHFEAIYPTLARANGLRVEDIGGNGPLVPPRRRDRLYNNSVFDATLYPGTFRAEPAVSDRYFAEGGLNFPIRDRLWHPVKTAAWHTSRRLPLLTREDVGIVATLPAA